MKTAFRVSALVVTLAVAACSTSPTSPWSIAVTSIAPSISGTWKGLFEIVSCTGGPGRCSGSPVRDFTLVLAPAGAGVEGFMLLEDNTGVSIDVRGARDASGAMIFTATGGLQPGLYQDRVDVGAFSLREDPASGLAGALEYSTTVEDNGRVIDVTRRSVVFRSAVRLPVDAVRPGRFDGTWRGNYRTLSCSGDCATGVWYMDQPTGGSVTLTLTQNGTTLTGVLNGLLIQGTASGSTVNVDGAPLSPEPCQTCWDCDGICQYASRNLHARVDKLGRLTGTFEVSKKAWILNRHFRQTLTVELVGVTRHR